MSDNASFVKIILASLLLGIAWLLLEVLSITVHDPIIGFTDALIAGQGFLVVQLIFFVIIGLPVAVASLFIKMNWRTVGWLLLGLATLFFVTSQT
ncbi:MAG: hypothetical protein ACR2P6_05735, partial [Gammaproteobacteria bacterium]